MSADTEAMVANLLAAYIEAEDEAGVKLACSLVKHEELECEITEDDGEPEAFTPGATTLWVVSEHKLLVGGEVVAEWTRCARGDYGAGNHDRCFAATWDTEEDTNGGDSLPDAVVVALDCLGLEDSLPSVPEPDEPEADAEGEYAVLFKNDYAVSSGRDTWGVASRHATKEDAEAACDAKWRSFTAATTQGSYGPEWCVGVLEDGEWQPIVEDDN